MVAVNHGLLVIDKPRGITSRAALDRAKRWFARGERVGHTGTLDPLATGVLVLCIGAATRLAEYVQRMRKTYLAVLHLGVRSTSDDADGICVPVEGAVAPSPSAVASVLQEFVGDIEQVPPDFSAAKIDGRRAYELARRGTPPVLNARQVRVQELIIQRYEYPFVSLLIHCGKGTYIRSLARDVGARLGCGAIVKSLRRTHVGPFSADAAVALDTDAGSALRSLLPLEAALAELPRVVVSAADAARLRCGQSILRLTEDDLPAEASVFDDQGKLIGLVAGNANDRSLAPTKILARAEAGT